jgi:hypothetical protein
MEYCELGDLQEELDSGKQYEESVSYSIFFKFYFFFFLGNKKMVISCWPWSSEASLC